jgi:hypothetical protein
MPLRDDLAPVVEKVDLLLTELRELRSSGPRFRIIHRFREPGSGCAPGEEVAAIYFVNRSAETLIPLPLALRILFDFLAHHSRFPQNASQIAAAIAVEPFYRYHGTNVPRHSKLTRKISRACVKEFVKRIRRALGDAFVSAGVRYDPATVLISEHTVTNEVGYRLKATFDWFHVDHPGRIERL